MKRINLRTTFLILMIVLSLVLSGLIFSKQTFLPRDPKIRAGLTSKQSDEESIQSEIKVLGPSQIIYYKEGKAEMINTQDLFALFSDYAINSKSLSHLRAQKSQVAPHEAFSRLDEEDAIVHTFDSFVPFSIYSNMFEDLEENFEQESFDFIFFSLNDVGVVHFYNSKTKVYYTADVMNESISKLAEQFRKEDLDSREMNLYFLGGKPIYLPVKPTQVSYYDYLLNRIPNSTVVDQLFQDLSGVNLRSYNDYVNYWDFQSSLRVEDQTNIMTFETTGQSSDKLSLDELLTRSFNALASYEKWEQGIHYDSVDSKEKKIFFRRYLKGYPVFSKNGEEMISIGLQDENLAFLRMSLSVAEIPIDMQEDSYYKTLDSGQEVIDKINEANVNQSLIESIRIGLRWEYSKESQRVVHFSPDWFICYDGQWQLLDDLLSN